MYYNITTRFDSLLYEGKIQNALNFLDDLAPPRQAQVMLLFIILKPLNDLCYC